MELCRFGPPGRERPGIVDAQGIVRDASSMVPDYDLGAVTFAEIVAGLASRTPQSLAASSSLCGPNDSIMMPPDATRLDREAELAVVDVNGEAMQRSSNSRMIFGVAHLVHYISSFMTLEPGDVVSTGTPPGVGMGRKPPRIERPGVQRQVIVEEPAA